MLERFNCNHLLCKGQPRSHCLFPRERGCVRASLSGSASIVPFHLNFVFSSGNLACSGEDRRLRILRNCRRKEIVGVVGCPSLRACVSCGMLIEHVRACKHMKCPCGKEFCFICLKPRENSGWKCGGYNEACTIAPVQTKIPGDS